MDISPVPLFCALYFLMDFHLSFINDCHSTESLTSWPYQKLHECCCKTTKDSAGQLLWCLFGVNSQIVLQRPQAKRLWQIWTKPGIIHISWVKLLKASCVRFYQGSASSVKLFVVAKIFIGSSFHCGSSNDWKNQTLNFFF